MLVTNVTDRHKLLCFQLTLPHLADVAVNEADLGGCVFDACNRGHVLALNGGALLTGSLSRPAAASQLHLGMFRAACASRIMLQVSLQPPDSSSSAPESQGH